MIDDGYFNLEEVPANEDFDLSFDDDEFVDFEEKSNGIDHADDDFFGDEEEKEAELEEGKEGERIMEIQSDKNKILEEIPEEDEDLVRIFRFGG